MHICVYLNLKRYVWKEQFKGFRICSFGFHKKSHLYVTQNWLFWIMEPEESFYLNYMLYVKKLIKNLLIASKLLQSYWNSD